MTAERLRLEERGPVDGLILQPVDAEQQIPAMYRGLTGWESAMVGGRLVTAVVMLAGGVAVQNVSRWTGSHAKMLRAALRMTVESSAEHLGVSAATVAKWERRGPAITPLPDTQAILDTALSQATDEQRARFEEGLALGSVSAVRKSVLVDADEVAALELMRRVAASDVSDQTLTQLELVVDDLATGYPVTPPGDLLGRIRQYLGYVESLIDCRMTLKERQRLTVVGAWLSLLAATVHIDLEQGSAAKARLRAAAELARHAGHREIEAWTLETDAWRVLTLGQYRRAVDLSRAAQALAPAGSSVAVQAASQEGRAWARLGDAQETYRAVGRVQRLVAPMVPSDRPEHHYRYDPEKSVAYVATTLAWLGDPAAETYAREIIRRLSCGSLGGKWPRRMASANLDLALSLLLTGKHDEACDATMRGIGSGRVAPSNHWRAAEVVQAVEAVHVSGAVDLREAYQQLVSPRGIARN